jgi:hypothetical protein
MKQGDILLEVQGSPTSLLQLHQAEGTAEARKELDQAKKRFEMKLATNQELNQAEKAASDAELQLESLKAHGVAADNKIRSMTTFAAVLALLPLALGIGQGSSMLKPLAIAIVSGLVWQLPLVLIVLPCLLALFRPGPRGVRRNNQALPSLVNTPR